MLQRIFGSMAKTVALGLDLKPGDKDYRAYVGPPQDYDLVSAMVFNLLTSIGLRQHHRVLDIGCGSLRVGRLLIPYLNSRNYFGVEPNKWLVDDGIKNEIGMDLVEIKKPTFSFRPSMEEFEKPLNIDYAIAQSVFSHCGKDYIKGWLSQISFHLKDNGALIATFLADDKDYNGHGWIYPGCVKYKHETVAEIASEFGLDFEVLDWAHPRQTWALFSKTKYDKSLVDGGSISWNRFVAKAMREQ
jgi:cyclopropane fatty-acyl-phospholipid synthase-like methyltransferase